MYFFVNRAQLYTGETKVALKETLASYAQNLNHGESLKILRLMLTAGDSCELGNSSHRTKRLVLKRG